MVRNLELTPSCDVSRHVKFITNVKCCTNSGYAENVGPNLCLLSNLCNHVEDYRLQGVISKFQSGSMPQIFSGK